MAQIGPRASNKRPQYAQRVYYTRAIGGRLIASVWPTTRKARPSGVQLTNQQVFQARLWWTKHIHEREFSPMYEALQRFLRRNQGLRGSAAIRWRDLLLQIASGRLWSFGLPDGRTLYTWSVRREQSYILDWFEPRIGSLLARTSKGWLPTQTAEPGAVLTMTPDTDVAQCVPRASLNLDNPL